MRRTGSIILGNVVVAGLGLSAAGAWYLGGMTSRACPEDTAMPGIPAESPFAPNYPLARSKFLEAVAATGAEVDSLQHPLPGPDGQATFMDLVWYGAPDATKVLVLSSGTHGVEGFAGSGIQTALLRDAYFSDLPEDLAVLIIHGINPYGMAHLRRFDENNVDLNRNFRDHATPAPVNQPYVDLADAIAPDSLSFSAEIANWSRLFQARLT